MQLKINVRPDSPDSPDSSRWSVHAWLSRFRKHQEEKTKRRQRLQGSLNQDSIRRVETILTGISYDEWLRLVSETDILCYISAKIPFLPCPIVLFNAICRYPFTRKKHMMEICGKFHDLLIQIDIHHQPDILSVMSGFFEAAGFTPALNELIWRRNYLIMHRSRAALDDGIIMVLDHAISSLLREQKALDRTKGASYKETG